MGFPCGSAGKEFACYAGDLGSIPGLGRSHGEGKMYPLQYSYLDSPMDRGAWWTTVHGVTRVRHDLATKPPPPPPFIEYQGADALMHNALLFAVPFCPAAKAVA